MNASLPERFIYRASPEDSQGRAAKMNGVDAIRGNDRPVALIKWPRRTMTIRQLEN